MDVSLTVERTFDRYLILSIASTCFYDIVEDGTPEHVLEQCIDEISDCWVQISDGKQILGLVQFKPYNRSMLDVHSYLPREHRNKSEKIVKKALDWMADYAPPMYKTLITNVPTCKRYAMLFVRKLGFKEIGRYKDAYNKDDKYHDMVLYQRSLQHEHSN